MNIQGIAIIATCPLCCGGAHTVGYRHEVPYLECRGCHRFHLLNDAERAEIVAMAERLIDLLWRPAPGSLADLQRVLGDGVAMGLADPAALHEVTAQAVGERP